jgi:hypothetical protein
MEVLCRIVFECDTPKKLTVIKICLNQSYSKERVGKYLSDTCPIQNGFKEGHSLSPLLLNWP